MQMSGCLFALVVCRGREEKVPEIPGVHPSCRDRNQIPSKNRLTTSWRNCGESDAK